MGVDAGTSAAGRMLAEGRVAHERHDWSTAFDRFHAVDALEPLEPPDLERYAASAGRTGSPDWNALLERAQVAFERARDRRGGARMALQLARNHVLLGENDLGVGWWLRAGRLLEDEGDCPERGLWLWMEGRTYMSSGDLERGHGLAREAAEIGRRTGDRDVEALGLLDEGHYLLMAGTVPEGLGLLSEATALAVGGSLDPSTAGVVLCGMIWACRHLGDWRQAAEWTDVSVRYCDRETGYYYPGLCRVHRAEIVRVRGRYDEAERDILEACDQLLARSRSSAAWAFGELGEVRLRRGDLSGAGEAFRRAIELGVEPQPGLARLSEAQGDATGALRSLERVLSDSSLSSVENQPYVLPVMVSIAIAADDVEAARTALGRMEALGPIVQSAAHQAALETARGELALADDRIDDAVGHLRRATQAWCDVEAPYEAAKARMMLARAYEADGDPSRAQLELETALSSFERLGAARDAQECRKVASSTRDERAVRTFMFTDIVESTKLVDALGDEAWNDLLRWHDGRLRSYFEQHHGDEIKHEGDGFFVAFASAKAAINCAVEVQRSLAQHRREQGFALLVRIGIHTADATFRNGDYTGRGVHETARVCAAGSAGEILVTESSIDGVKVPVAEHRSLQLKGFAEPLDAVLVDWTRS